MCTLGLIFIEQKRVQFNEPLERLQIKALSSLYRLHRAAAQPEKGWARRGPRGCQAADRRIGRAAEDSAQGPVA